MEKVLAIMKEELKEAERLLEIAVQQKDNVAISVLKDRIKYFKSYENKGIPIKMTT